MTTETANQPRVYFLVLLSYVVLAFFFFKDFFIRDYFTGDFASFWLPNYKFVFASLKQGQLPFWQPYSYLGVAGVFNPSYGFFQPTILFTAVINFIFNRSLLMDFIGKSMEISQYIGVIAASFGTFLVIRQVFKRTLMTSVFAGVIYGFSLSTLVSIPDMLSLPGKALVPWLILTSYLVITRGRPLYFLANIALNYVLLSTGYPYYIIYLLLLQVGLGIFYGLRPTFKIGISLILSVMLSAFIFLPISHNYQQASRFSAKASDTEFYSGSSYIPSRFINILIPQIFTKYYSPKDPGNYFSFGNLTWGVFPLMLLFFGLSRLPKSPKNSWAITVFILAFVYSLGGYIGSIQFINSFFPLIAKLRSHGQALTLTFFMGVAFISYGMDYLLSGQLSKSVFKVFLGLGALGFLVTTGLALTSWAGGTELAVALSRTTLLLFFSCLIYWYTATHRSILFLGLGILLMLVESRFYYSQVEFLHQKTTYNVYYNPDKLVVDTPTPNNMFRYSFEGNQFMYHTDYIPLFNYTGYEPIVYSAFTSTARLGSEGGYNFANVRYIVTPDSTLSAKYSHFHLIRTVDSPDPKKAVFIMDRPDTPLWGPVFNRIYYIYENDHYLPRFFVPHAILKCSDLVKCFTRRDILSDMVLETDDPRILSDYSNSSTNSTLDIVSYTPNKITLKSNESVDVFYSSSEVWDSGWQIFINGKQDVVYNVNSGFRAFLIPKGSQLIQLVFRPPLLGLGLLLSLSTLAGLIFFTLLKNRK